MRLEFNQRTSLLRFAHEVPRIYYMQETELFTPREENTARTFASATKAVEALEGHKWTSAPLVLTRKLDSGEILELVLDPTKKKEFTTMVGVLRGARNGSARELIQDGLGTAVVDIYNATHHNRNEEGK